MFKLKPAGIYTSGEAFQSALDALDIIGRWEWDAATDCTRSDAFVALLFNIDPGQAESGAPLCAYVEAIHSDDRDRVLALIRSSAKDGSAFVTEYRVISADGRTRWLLARGRFTADHLGRPVGGSGILVDITRMRLIEGTFSESESPSSTPPLEQAAEHALAAQAAITRLKDPILKEQADTLLMSLGRKLALQETRDRRNRMN